MDSSTMEAIKTGVAALSGTVGAVFAFLNWRKNRLAEEPKATLGQSEPLKSGLIDNTLYVENPSSKDIRLDIVELTCGSFVGDELRDSCGGVKGYERGPNTIMQCPMLVAAKDRRGVHVRFHTDPGVTVVAARLVRSGSGYRALLFASK